MIRWISAIALLGPGLLLGQLQLHVAPQNGTEMAVTGVQELGSVAVSDALDTRFRIRNLGSAPVTLTSLSVRGSGFSMFGQPSLPHTVAPGLNVDFTIRFLVQTFGAYSANLSVNGTSILLRASAAGGAAVSLDGTRLAAGSTVDFGRVERKKSITRRFTLQNAGLEPFDLSSVKVTGEGFRLDVPGGSRQLAAGASQEVTVLFEPQSSGILTGSLQVAERSFKLVATAIEPPFPRPAVIIDLPVVSSSQQGKVSVKLDSASRAAGAGKLRIELRPLAGMPESDGALQFVDSAARTLDFRVAEGEDTALFGTLREAVFQTGTTAGTLVITAEVGGFTEQATVVIPPAAVKVETSRVARGGSTLDLQVTGFDNTRTLSQLAFTFFDGAGRTIQPGAIRLDATADFQRFFGASTLGGVFSLRAQFPVTGSAADVSGVEIEMVNSSGAARTERLRF